MISLAQPVSPSRVVPNSSYGAIAPAVMMITPPGPRVNSRVKVLHFEKHMGGSLNKQLPCCITETQKPPHGRWC